LLNEELSKTFTADATNRTTKSPPKRRIDRPPTPEDRCEKK